MKKAILNMKAFYISLFVVLFFPLGLMGQDEATTLQAATTLQNGDILYIKDEVGNVMIAESATKLGAQTNMGDDASSMGDDASSMGDDASSLWVVVSDFTGSLFIQNCKYKSYLQLKDQAYVLTPDFLQATPINHSNFNWYLGSIPKTFDFQICCSFRYKWLFGTVNKQGVYLTYKYDIDIYSRPKFENGQWVSGTKIIEDCSSINAKGDEVKKIALEYARNEKISANSITMDWAQYDSYPIKCSGIFEDTKAYKIAEFKFICEDTPQKVHEFIEVIYVDDNTKSIDLSLPVDGASDKTVLQEAIDVAAALLREYNYNLLYLREILSKVSERFARDVYFLKGFYRWYNYDGRQNINQNIAMGKLEHFGYSVNETIDIPLSDPVNIIIDMPTSYKETVNNNGQILLSGNNCGTTKYILPDQFTSEQVIRIACDVSNYDNYEFGLNNDFVAEITEPTLSYRVIYEIRHASKIASAVNECNSSEKFFETYEIIAPANQKILIGPKYICNGDGSNYYNKSGDNIVKISKPKWTRFEYNATNNTFEVKDGDWDNNNDYNETYEDNQHISITAPGDGQKHMYYMTDDKGGCYIAKFVVTGYNSAIVGPSEKPLIRDSKFDLKAELDFDDIYDANNPKMYPEPLPWEDISAGFVYPTLIELKNKQREPEFVAMSEYALLSTTEGYKKCGNDLPLITNHGEDLPNEKKGKGYFLYVDATKKTSKVADLSINGDLCPNSKIYVSAWIANASNEISNYPNLNFVMMGCMTDDNGKIISETQVATFTTGEVKTKGKWMHIMFEFVTTEVEYDKYRLRIENNNAAYFGVGNDFAIDDIKIYMESRTEATLTQNRSCPSWSSKKSDLNKSNVAILKSNIIDISSGDVPMYYSWFKKKGENADGSSVEVEHFPLDNYINNTNGNYGIITVNKEWIDIVKKELYKDGILSFPDNDNSSASISVSEGKYIDVYASVDDYLRVNKYNAEVKKVGYFFTVEGSGDDALLALHIVHKDLLFQQHEEYTSIVTPMNLPVYIAGFSAGDLSSAKEKRALEALYNELKCGDRSQLIILPYSSIMLKGTSSNYDFDFTQAVVKHLAKGQSYTFAVEAYYEGTDEDGKSVMMPYNCYADWLLVTNDGDKYKWEDAQDIINWREGGEKPTLSKDNTLTSGNTLMTLETGSDNSFQVENFSGPLHYIAIPDPNPNKAFFPDLNNRDVFYTPCAIPVEIYLYDSIPATLANPEVSEATDTWNYDRPAAICNEPIIVRIPNSLVKDNISLNLDIDYFDKYLFAEIAKYNEKTQDKNPYPLSEIYLYEKTEQDLYEKAEQEAYKFNITAKDANNQTLTLELLKKNDAVSISGGHDDFKSGKKYHFAGHNVVNGVTITPPFQFDVYVVPDEVVWTGAKGTAWHNDANWNPAFVPLSATNVRIPNTENKPVLNPSADKFEAGANELLKHDIVTLNSCKDIYFEAGAQLANQHMLNYERAFVDVPFTGNGNDNFGKSNKNFKIMSFPLRNVYRGDLYIPKDGDRRPFDFANPVEVDNRAYNSFYVKAYVSAIEQNYVNENNDVDVQEYKYEDTSWSDPTSVLNFEFEEAHGYAVSLDAKINFDSETKEYDKNIQSFVRLPKSETEYYLFMDFGEGNEIELKGLGSTWPTYEISEFQLDKDGKRIRSSEGHKLVYDKDHGASVTFENKKGIFLIGNPFMTGMKVKEFLQENKTYLNTDVYYIYDKDIITVEFVNENDRVIPPFGALFVKGNSTSKTQTFTFTPAMMSYTQSPEPSTQQRAPRMVEERELLTITAEVDGARSRTYIEKDFAANNEYLDTEDADLLVLDADLTPISVYSVATGAALAYNSVTDMEFVPLGLLLVDSTIVAKSVRFTFDGVDYFYDELYLYDALYNSYLPLIDGVALELEMPESGELRYFITDTKHNVGGGVTTSDDLVEGSKVCVFTTEGEACIIAEDIISEATVYDIAGRLIYYSDQISSSQHNISLPNGVYMLKVVVNSNLSTHKIILK